MTESPRTRWRQAVLAVAVAAMLATAGCSGFLNSGGSTDGGSASAAKLDSVPASAEAVGYVDVDGLMSDSSVRSLANTMLEQQSQQVPGSDVSSVEDALSKIEEQTGLSPTKIHDVTFFSTSNDAAPTESGSGAMIVTTDFTENELVSSMRDSGTELSKGTYAGTTIYTYGDDSALAALGDGTFVLGNEQAVKSVLDVRAGNQEALGGELRSAFEATHSGYVRYAVKVPQDQIPAGEFGENAPVNTSSFNSIQYVSGAFYTSGNEVTVTMNLVSESSDSASRAYQVLNGALSLYKGVLEGERRAVLESISVSQNGDTVTVTYSDSVSNIEDLLKGLYGSA